MLPEISYQLLLRYFGNNEFFSVSFLLSKRPFLVHTHQSGIADHVGGMNGSEPALHLPSPFDERLMKIGGRVY